MWFLSWNHAKSKFSGCNNKAYFVNKHYFVNDLLNVFIMINCAEACYNKCYVFSIYQCMSGRSLPYTASVYVSDAWAAAIRLYWCTLHLYSIYSNTDNKSSHRTLFKLSVSVLQRAAALLHLGSSWLALPWESLDPPDPPERRQTNAVRSRAVKAAAERRAPAARETVRHLHLYVEY